MEQKQLGRKGNVADVLVFTIYILVTAVGLILVGFFMTQFGEKLEGTPLQDTAVGNKSIAFINQIGDENIPKYFTILFIFDIIGIIGTSFLISLALPFFILYIIFIAFAVILAVFSMSFYDKFSEVSALQAYIADQTMINAIFQHAPLITLIVGVISAIIIMAKLPGGGQDI